MAYSRYNMKFALNSLSIYFVKVQNLSIAGQSFIKHFGFTVHYKSLLSATVTKNQPAGQSSASSSVSQAPLPSSAVAFETLPQSSLLDRQSSSCRQYSA